MLAANSGNFVQLRGVAVQVNDDHRLGRAVQRKGTAQSGGGHIPRLPLRVDKHRLRAAVGHGVGGGRKGQALAKYRVACLHACEDHRKVQRRRTGREGDRIALTHKFTHGFFKFVDVFTQRRDPVLLKRIVDVFQFIALVRHMRAGQQKSFIHVLLLCFRPPDVKICFGRAYSLQKRDKAASFLPAATAYRNAQVHRSMYIAVSHPKNVGITPFLLLNYTTYG